MEYRKCWSWNCNNGRTEEKALKKKKKGKKRKKEKDGKLPGKDNLNSKLYKDAGDSFHERLLVFFNNIYVMGEMLEKWKNSIVLPMYKKVDKQKVENYRKISLLNACYKLYSKILSEKLKASRIVPFGMPELISKRQIWQWSIE